MGSFSSKKANKVHINEETNDPSYVPSSTRWKPFLKAKTARALFIGDKTMPKNATDSMFELRVFMDDNDLFKSLSKYASDTPWHVFLRCWVDVQTYKGIDPAGVEQQKGFATFMYNTYLLPDVEIVRNNIDVIKTREIFKKLMDEIADDEPFPCDVFDEVQRACFMGLYERVWPKFQTSDGYTDAVNTLKRHNQVCVCMW